MSDERRLLDAIEATPDDDAPRLVYADWLLGRGDPRGELIHLQCRLAAAPDDDRRRNIRIAENKLLAAHGETWKRPILAAMPAPVLELEFVRGFVEAAKISIAALAHVDALWAAAPMLRRMAIAPNTFDGPKLQQPQLGDALDAPQLARLTSLDLTLPGGGNQLAFDVARSPALANLRELTIRGSVWGGSVVFFNVFSDDLAIDEQGATLLADSPHLVGLRHLNIADNRLAIEGVRALARGKWRLRALELGNNAIEGTGLAAALDTPALSELEILELSHAPHDPDAAAALAGSATLKHLRELDLESCHLGAPGMNAFCNAFASPTLRRLRIERNSLGDAGAIAVAKCAKLATLTSLEAGHNRIGHKGAVALASSPHLAQLERLTLNEPRWKPDTSALFGESPTLASTRIYLKGKLLARRR